MSKVQGYRTTIQPRRPPHAPKGREGKGVAEAPYSPSSTPPLREKGVSTYIGRARDQYRFVCGPILVHSQTTIGFTCIPLLVRMWNQ